MDVEMDLALTEFTDEQLEEMLEFLDCVREAGFTNMYGASPYVAEEFEISEPVARKVLVFWMETFGDRHGL